MATRRQVFQVIGLSSAFALVAIARFLPDVWLVPATAHVGGIAGWLLVPSGERLRAELAGIAAGIAALFASVWLGRWWFDADYRSYWQILATVLVSWLPFAILGVLAVERLGRHDPPIPRARSRRR
jgi:hypothetical protein